MPEKRTPKDMSQMSEKMRFIIDSYAAFWSPSRILKGIVENFGETEKIKMNTVVGYKMQYEDMILQRRKEIGIELPIINPMSRFAMAQEIYDMAMNGVDRVVRGEIMSLPDPKTAIEAVKLAHTMSGTKDEGQVMDSDIIRSVVKEAYQQIRDVNPEMTETDVVNLLMASMQEDALPYVQEISIGLNN